VQGFVDSEVQKAEHIVASEMGGMRVPNRTTVYTMSVTVVELLVAKFLTISLLTSIAPDLRTTEGVSGQTVTTIASVAMVVSPLTSIVA
jgi:predicted MFS family arabinose efflux permease